MRSTVNCKRCLIAANLMLFAALFVFGLAGCAKQAQTSGQAQSQAETQAQHYQLKGKVVSVNTANSSLEVDMEAIPGYMGAMTMSYPVHDAGLLSRIHTSDFITADLVVSWRRRLSRARRGEEKMRKRKGRGASLRRELRCSLYARRSVRAGWHREDQQILRCRKASAPH